MDGRPDYLRVADTIRAGIEQGVHPPGAQLPTIDELAAILEVSATTVKNGLRELKREGLIYGRPGKGVFVAER